MKNKKKHNIFLMLGEEFNLEWIDENNMLLEGKKLDINSNYDFRKKKKNTEQ
ncbi:hypothetical protein [Psychrobacillus glaciei]|uniref:hypothetical protein n=1 Tax=Psychrobacillus glaciei TaxID=2283160 RepID=UPI00178C8236|nr:hypothetical protein [Psychrobacillus glaciei]